MNAQPVAAPTALGAIVQSIDASSPSCLRQIIEAAREHLDADIGFLCEFENGRKVIRESVGGIHGRAVPNGTHFDLEETYCRRVAQGELPNVIHDARTDPRVCHMDITRTLDIGTYISVPVMIPGGRVFGTLCCISHEVDPSVQTRDVRYLRVLADLLGNSLGEEERIASVQRRQSEQIRGLVKQGLSIAFQPIVSLADGAVVGMEALSRFDTQPYRTPDLWFADAWRLGMGEELERAALQAALAHQSRLPDGVYLAINLSPRALQSAETLQMLHEAGPGPIVLEITEHAVIEEYGPLIEALQRYSERGTVIAVDDFGAGYSGLSHALRVRPRVLKLDMQLTRDIHRDEAKQALVGATVGFAGRMAVDVVAEGIECSEEAQMLRGLGVRYGQGYHFGRPAPLAA